MRAHAPRPLAWVVAGILAAFAAAPAGAQVPERVTILKSENPDLVPDLVLRESPFQLKGLADIAFGGVRNRGVHINLVSNDGTINWTQGNPAGIFIRGTPRGTISPYFLADFIAGVPRGDWEKARQLAPSLNNALGGGYSVNYNINAFFLPLYGQWRPADDQFGRVHSGESSTTDGTCLQHEFLEDGRPLMAISDCPPTWGSEQFAGAARKTTLQQWVQLFEDVGAENFTWDWWRVPEEYVSDELMGDAQTYYTFVDWAADRLALFGNVVPDGTGEPTETGWPLGLTVKTDVFSFSLPTVADAAIYQMLLINDSEKVYGVGLDYDSVYVGNGHGALFQSQSAGHYWRPELGGILLANAGINPNCNGAITTGVGACQYPAGLNNGATAIIFLKSPIGDLRNKLFSRPESPFYAPDHPLAGDTITFNHGRRCSFGACYGNAIDFTERSEFGLISSTPQNVLDGRTPSAIDAAWWDIFSNVDFPERTAEFPTYVPGDWDYNHDGVPDTIHANSCHTNGCVEAFSDTLPGGHNNRSGNFFGMTTAGPFRLAAGDTVGITMAFVSGTSHTDLLQNVQNVIDFYLNGYLGPTPPPAPAVVAVNVRPGDRGADQRPPARVQIFFDDAAEQWEDPFLALSAQQIEGTQLVVDNPWLLDSLRAHISSNVGRILVFKSCDGGESFTASGDCRGDPLVDENGDPVESGWRPYAVIEPDDDGSFPNVFVDEAVTPGVTYIYSFVAESKGFLPLVLARDEEGNLFPTEFERGAPPLRNPLSRSTSDPNVVAVYVPASRQVGARDPEVAFVDEDAFFRSTVDSLVVEITGDPATGATLRAVFGDSVVVQEVQWEGTVQSTVDVYRTVDTSQDGVNLERLVYAHETFTSSSSEGVDVGGGVTTRSEVGDSLVITTVFDALTLVVLDDGNRPIFASSRLSGGTTPGSVLSRQDIPLFLLEIDQSRAGEHISDVWQAPRDGELADLRAGGRPDVEWIEAQAVAAIDLLGEYALDWQGPAYGPREAFIPNLTNPSATEEELAASLAARVVAQRTSTSAEVAAAIGVDPADLLDTPLPFTVTNATTGQPVTVAMRKSDKRATMLIGRLNDEIEVAVPADIWVPGEPLIFLERRSLPRTATTADGEEYVVVQNGQPVLVDSLVVTFDPAVLGCNAPRVTCNPVPARAPGANVNGFLAVDPGMRLRVRYGSALRATSSFSFEIKPAQRGNQVTEATREDLRQIKVVPNPYVVFSEYEQERDSEVARLMFAGLPPQGTITIFTISGQIVQRIAFTEQDLSGNGDLFWDMRTLENNDLGAGLYLFVVEGTLPASGRSIRKLGKFVVIR